MKREMRTPELEAALREARRVTKEFGTSYYTATLLFPADTREAVFAVYGLVRTADEIVDSENSGDMQTALQKLQEFEDAWQTAYEHGYSGDPILYAAAWVFRTYSIPFVYSQDFFAAMRTDTHTTRYETYVDLEKYMYGSAAVIGLILTRIIGAKSDDALPRAAALGNAMQLTNFLRDIREDYVERGRIYIPQEELRMFGVTEEMIAREEVAPEFKELMKFEIARARALYAQADTGIPLLTRSGRKPVRLARVLYSKILDRIEDAHYDVFSQRRYTTRMQKLRYALPVLLSV